VRVPESPRSARAPWYLAPIGIVGYVLLLFILSSFAFIVLDVIVRIWAGGHAAVVICLLVIMAIWLIVAVGAIINAVSRPAWQLPSKRKVAWILSIVLATIFLGPLGGMIGLAYLIRVRPNLRPAPG